MNSDASKQPERVSLENVAASASASASAPGSSSDVSLLSQQLLEQISSSSQASRLAEAMSASSSLAALLEQQRNAIRAQITESSRIQEPEKRKQAQVEIMRQCAEQVEPEIANLLAS